MKKGFFHHALILTVAGILVRILGAVYRIILPRLIGAEGVGLYQMAYPVFSILLVLAIPGFPLAISKLVAESVAEGKEDKAGLLFFGSLLVLFLSGFLLTIALLYFAPLIVSRLGDHRTLYPLIFLAPSLIFFFLMSAFRGYFQGLENMFPTAISLVLEQLVRLITILLVLYFLRDAPLEYMAGGVALGNLTGSLFGLTILFILFLRQGSRISFPINSIRVAFSQGIRIYPLALPISFGGLIMPLMSLVDAFIVPNRLQMAGWTMEEATSLYGQLSGMAMTVFFFPTVVSGAIALTILPFVSHARMKGDFQGIYRRTDQAFRLNSLIMLPATVGIMVLSQPICHLLFGYPQAGIPLFYLALGLTFYALQDISASILQGLDLIKIPAFNLMIGAIVNGSLNYTLTPLLGIRGAAIGTITGIFIGGSLNLRALHQEVGFSFLGVRETLKPITGALAMGIFIMYLHPFLSGRLVSESLATILAIIAGMIVYSFLILISGGIKIKDLSFLPIIGPKIHTFFNS